MLRPPFRFRPVNTPFFAQRHFVSGFLFTCFSRFRLFYTLLPKYFGSKIFPQFPFCQRQHRRPQEKEGSNAFFPLPPTLFSVAEITFFSRPTFSPLFFFFRRARDSRRREKFLKTAKADLGPESKKKGKKGGTRKTTDCRRSVRRNKFQSLATPF